jgi:hypothetical protein
LDVELHQRDRRAPTASRDDRAFLNRYRSTPRVGGKGGIWFFVCFVVLGFGIDESYARSPFETRSSITKPR